MTIPIKAGFLSALMALSVSATGISLLYLVLEAPGGIKGVPITLTCIAPFAAFGTVWLVARSRLERSEAPLGALRGGLIALGIFAIGVFVHAAFRPGAAGLLVSFLGQFVMSFLLMGWLAVLAGCLSGALIDRMADN